jgi:hypothetical protein
LSAAHDLIGLVLSGVVVRETRDYLRRMDEEKHRGVN